MNQISTASKFTLWHSREGGFKSPVDISLRKFTRHLPTKFGGNSILKSFNC